MKTVFITCLHLKYGGVEKVIASLANALTEEGYQIVILCTYYFDEPAYAIDPKVKICYLTSRVPNRDAFYAAIKDRKFFTALKEGAKAFRTLYLKRQTMKIAIKKIHGGAVISTRNEHTVLLSKYGRPDVLKIAQLHSDHHFDPKLVSNFRHDYKNIDYFVLLTDKTKSEVQKMMQGYNSHTKCVTIPNFVEPCELYGKYQKKKQIIAAGRLHPDKNFASLLRIWAKIIQREPDFCLLIAGEGALESSLKKQAVDLGVSGSVRFTGALPHKQLLIEMAQSYCYALTSVSESFGLVLVESMMCGTPPVAYNVRVGPEAIIDDGVNGYLIPEGNEQQFADKVVELIENHAMREKMERNATIKAATFYKDQVLPKWNAILEKL